MKKRMTRGERNEHRACGRVSGIPECCVRFWLSNYWQYMNDADKLVYHTLIPDKVQYIPCPTCLAKREFVEILKVEDCDHVIPTLCPHLRTCKLWRAHGKNKNLS